MRVKLWGIQCQNNSHIIGRRNTHPRVRRFGRPDDYHSTENGETHTEELFGVEALFQDDGREDAIGYEGLSKSQLWSTPSKPSLGDLPQYPMGRRHWLAQSHS